MISGSSLFNWCKTHISQIAKYVLIWPKSFFLKSLSNRIIKSKDKEGIKMEKIKRKQKHIKDEKGRETENENEKWKERNTGKIYS